MTKEMDSRVGCGAVSVLANITEEAIRASVDIRGKYIGSPDLIVKYQELRKYLDNQ